MHTIFSLAVWYCRTPYSHVSQSCGFGLTYEFPTLHPWRASQTCCRQFSNCTFCSLGAGKESSGWILPCRAGHLQDCLLLVASRLSPAICGVDQSCIFWIWHVRSCNGVSRCGLLRGPHPLPLSIVTSLLVVWCCSAPSSARPPCPLVPFRSPSSWPILLVLLVWHLLYPFPCPPFLLFPRLFPLLGGAHPILHPVVSTTVLVLPIATIRVVV